jgi:anaerobic magnesium-protoporphyrin IX monomethyl ester cyclase
VSDTARVLLVNPTIAAPRHARFPLSVLALAAALEGQFETTLLDGNLERDTIAAALNMLGDLPFRAVGLTVMGGPQLRPAIELSRAIRARHPAMPIIWGGYFPTLYSDAALNNDYVDYLIRGEGEAALHRLLAALPAADPHELGGIPSLSWRDGGAVRHNAGGKLVNARPGLPLPYDKLGDPRRYLVSSFLGARTAAHQASVGCRFRCTFCGVASMFRGGTALPAAERLDADLHYLKHGLGADSIQYYDHNFFDREEDMVPLLEVMARHELPWWCYARADALLGLSRESWALVRRSRLRMAYIGAESPSDAMLKQVRKGTRADQTLEVAELCRAQGVIPELSFMVAPPHDAEGETKRTFEFIRQVKKVNPQAEIIVYVYTPLPPESVPGSARLKLPPLLVNGEPVVFPATPEQWTQRQWVDYACHADAPWLTEDLRRQIHDFVTVLRCRFPTVQDTRSPRWAKLALRGLASWRYSLRRYHRPWELNVSKNLIDLLDPRASGI